MPFTRRYLEQSKSMEAGPFLVRRKLLSRSLLATLTLPLIRETSPFFLMVMIRRVIVGQASGSVLSAPSICQRRGWYVLWWWLLFETD